MKLSVVLLTGVMLFLPCLLVVADPAPQSAESQLPAWFPAAPAPLLDSNTARVLAWIATSPGKLSLSLKGELLLKPLEHPVHLFYTGGLQANYRFETVVPALNGHILSFALGYLPANGQPHFRLIMRDDASVTLRREGKSDETLSFAPSGSWDFGVQGTSVTIFRNKTLVSSFTVEPAVPAIWLEADYQLTPYKAPAALALGKPRFTGASTGKAALVFRQWKIAGARQRYFTLIRDRAVADPGNAREGLLPLLFEKIEAACGRVLGVWGPRNVIGDPILAVWTNQSGGRNGPWAYIPAFTVGATQTAAHEMAHWYGGLRSGFDWKEETWLSEGLADFLANVGLNRLANRPDWVFASHFSNGSNWIHADGVDYPLGSFARLKAGETGGSSHAVFVRQSYLKGHMYLWLLAETVGWEAFLKQLASEPKSGDGMQWLKELELATGLAGGRFGSGWLSPGGYLEYSPIDFTDPLKEGLLVFQKKLRKLDTARPDSIAAGKLDLYSLIGERSGFRLPTLPSGALFDGVPDFAAGDTLKAISEAEAGLYGWQKLAMRKAPGGWEVVALRNLAVPYPHHLPIAYFLFNTSVGRLKLTYSQGMLNELSWVDEKERKPQSAMVPRFRETAAGFELFLPEQLLEGRLVSGVYCSRLGLVNNSWVDSPVSTLNL